MDELLSEIEHAYETGSFYLALFSCLALPDICGAISSADRRARGANYIAWFDRYVAPQYGKTFSGQACYAFRCAALHQGRTDHKLLGYSRVVFVAPSANHNIVMHNNVLNDALNLDLVLFCKDVIAGARRWIEDNSSTEPYSFNMNTFLRRHKGGLRPFIVGIDVFS